MNFSMAAALVAAPFVAMAAAIKKGVEKVGPMVTKTPVKLDSVSLSFLSGSGKVKGMVIGNPEGFRRTLGPLCGRIAAMVSIADLADRPPKPLADGESLRIGKRSVRWLDAPHVPHAWECGFLFEETQRTLFCGDLFTQGGRGETPVVETDILEPSERMRRGMDYFSHAPNARPVLERLASLRPTTLACMHGSAWRGAGDRLLLALADALAPTSRPPD